jgi:excisionase family DNA binding protein
MTPTTNPNVTSVLIDDAARRLRVCRRTIYYWIRSGRLQTKRIGATGRTQRVLMSSIEAIEGAAARKDEAAA